MREKIEDYIKTCLKYIAFSVSSGKVEGLVHDIPKGDKLSSDLHIDHLGPMFKSHSMKYKYILLIVMVLLSF